MKKQKHSSALICCWRDMLVSENRGTPKSSILIGFSIMNHPFWGTPIFGNTHLEETMVSNTLNRALANLVCVQLEVVEVFGGVYLNGGGILSKLQREHTPLKFYLLTPEIIKWCVMWIPDVWYPESWVCLGWWMGCVPIVDMLAWKWGHAPDNPRMPVNTEILTCF